MVSNRWQRLLFQPIRPGGSLQLRLYLPLIITMIGALALLAAYSLHKFEEASRLQLEHEGRLLTDALETALVPALSGEPDLPQIQAHIDRLTATRERNDVEINVMLLRDNRSYIVASNIADNVEKAEIYEHRSVLSVLESKEPSFFIGRDPGDPTEPSYPPSHPDYYVGPGNRFVSMTSPLFVDGQGLGAINIKISLKDIDRQIGAIRNRVLLIVLIVPWALLFIIWLIIHRGLRPLNRIARKTGEIGPGNLGYRFPVDGLPKELRPICLRLNDLFERLENAFARERRFSANVAHELRTPLTELRTLCEVWLDADEGEERDTDKILKDALKIADQMEHLVTSLLTLVRTESGQQQARRVETDLVASIRNAWKAFEEPARIKNLTLCLDTPALLTLETDKDLMSAILGNLFSNAVTYSPTGGSIRCQLASKNGNFQLDVENPTVDLQKNDLQHLTEPFWRKDTARTDNDQHSGLGLSLVVAYSRLLDLNLDIDLPEQGLFRVRIQGVSVPRPPGSVAG